MSMSTSPRMPISLILQSSEVKTLQVETYQLLPLPLPHWFSEKLYQELLLLRQCESQCPAR